MTAPTLANVFDDDGTYLGVVTASSTPMQFFGFALHGTQSDEQEVTPTEEEGNHD